MRWRTTWLFWTVLLAGCGPALSREDLGAIEKTLPRLPGLNKPYPMPELDPKPAPAPPTAAPEETLKEKDAPEQLFPYFLPRVLNPWIIGLSW